jgi:tetratricopeptide (TPR) repeat protein
MNLDPDVLLDLSCLLAIAGYKGEAESAASIVEWFPSYAPRFFAGAQNPQVVAGITTRAKELLQEISKSADRGKATDQPKAAPTVAQTSPSNDAISTAPQPLEPQSWTSVAVSVAKLIVDAFSSSRFNEFFGDQEFSDRWTQNDALAVWYFFGTVAMDIAIYDSPFESARKANEFGENCDTFLAKHWPMSQMVLARFKALRNNPKNAEEAFHAYHGCKTGADFAIFFPRCVSRILGSEVSFQGGSTVDLLLNGYDPKSFDSVLGAEFAKFFVDTVAATKKLIKEGRPVRTVSAEKPQETVQQTQQVSTAASAYPTKEQIAEFLEAKRKGGAEAIAKLLREKQAQTQQEAKNRPKLNQNAVLQEKRLLRKNVNWEGQNHPAEPKESHDSVETDDDLEFDTVQHPARIDAALSGKRWDEAQRLIEKALASQPDNWSPLGESDDSIYGSFWDMEEFQAYTRFRGHEKTICWVSPSYSKLWYQLAVVKSQQKKYDEAIECVQSGLRLEEHPYLWVKFGLILCDLSKFEQALTKFHMAEDACFSAKAPSRVRAWALRSEGYALIELRRFKEAKGTFLKSLELDPGNQTALNELDYIENLLHS